MKTPCDNCNTKENATHVIHHDNGDGTEIYCDSCWIIGGYATMTVPCPNLEPGETAEDHSCSLCDTLGEATITISTCCKAPEEWQDCELLDTDGEPHEECYKTVCENCGNVLHRDCLENNDED